MEPRYSVISTKFITHYIYSIHTQSIRTMIIAISFFSQLRGFRLPCGQMIPFFLWRCHLSFPKIKFMVFICALVTFTMFCTIALCFELFRFHNLSYCFWVKILIHCIYFLVMLFFSFILKFILFSVCQEIYYSTYICRSENNSEKFNENNI